MRILLVHNFYQQRGGEDAVVQYQLEMLKGRGHEVRLFAVHNDAIGSLGDRVRTFLLATYNPWARRALCRQIETFRPELVHVHNFFPQLSPSVFDACWEAGVPAVFSLHNFRILCPTGLLFHNGAICEKSIHGSSWWSVKARTYHQSRLGTLAVASMVEFHKWRGTWNTKVDRLIALTEFAKKKLIEGGISAQRVAVKPNAVIAPAAQEMDVPRAGALFLGRLSQEKGVLPLITAWNTLEYPLRIAGDGPLADAARRTAASHITFLGRLNTEQVRREIRAAAFLVLPSICYEMFPVTVIEAFSCGLPVLASRLGGLPEIIKDGETGLLFTPNDTEDLRQKARWAASHPEEMRRMGANAHAEYEREYTPEADYERLMKIYDDVIVRRSRSPLPSFTPEQPA